MEKIIKVGVYTAIAAAGGVAGYLCLKWRWARRTSPAPVKTWGEKNARTYAQ